MRVANVSTPASGVSGKRGPLDKASDVGLGCRGAGEVTVEVPVGGFKS